MTDTELYALESAAKAATPGPWKHYVDQGCNGVLASGKVILPILHISPENCAYIAAANPAVVLELIAELRQAKMYIAELERSGNRYDKAMAKIAATLGITHEDGYMPELQVITNEVERLKTAQGQTGFQIYSALEPGPISSNSCSIPPQEAICQK